MTYKQIEASREARLWLTQIIWPTVGLVTVVMMNPEAREFVTDKAKKAKKKIKTTFKK